MVIGCVEVFVVCYGLWVEYEFCCVIGDVDVVIICIVCYIVIVVDILDVVC